MELPAPLASLRIRISSLFRLPTTNPVARGLVRLRKFWHSLNFAQRCYGAATILWFLEAVLMLNLGSWFMSLLSLMVVAGLTSEFWPRFIHVWHSLPGKAVILLFYAVVANFALGTAAGMVNDVTGVAASALPYSHNFAILLSLPGWFFLTSLLALLLFTVLIMPLYLLLLLLLKPFGIHGLWHPPHYRFVFTTAIVRYVWSIALFLQLLMLGMATGVASEAGAFGRGVYEEVILNIEEQDDESIKLEAETRELGDAPVAQADVTSELNGNVGIHFRNKDGEAESIAFMPVKEVQERADRYHRLRESLLAEFIFAFEADSRSRCEHVEGSKVVELNDYEILEIVKDSAEEIGFSYRVKACVSPAFGH